MSEAWPRFRRILENLPGYQPGTTTPAAGRQSFKLSSNETPYGPLPSVAKVIAEAALSVNRYPDNGAELLTAAIAQRFDVPPGLLAACRGVGEADSFAVPAGQGDGGEDARVHIRLGCAAPGGALGHRPQRLDPAPQRLIVSGVR